MAVAPYPSFTGVQQSDVRGCNFTLSHGIQPGVAALQVRPLRNDPAEIGTLSFTMGSTRVVFPNCRIEDVVMPPGGGANNPASGPVNPAAQLPQERVGVMA